MIPLATSTHYTVFADQDYVYLKTPEGQFELGWMYGNAQGAYIDPREQWVVVIGCGLWVVRLPLRPDLNAQAPPVLSAVEVLSGAGDGFVSEPLVHLMAAPDDAMWLETVYFTGEHLNTVRVVADLNNRYAGIYDVDVDTLQITQRFSCVRVDHEPDA